MKTKLNIILLICLLMALFPFSQAFAQASPVAVGFEPKALNLTTGSDGEMAVSIQNVQGLYAFDITIKYDPAFVEIIDADPGAPGIQVNQGNFLEGGLAAINSVDSQSGVIRYAATELNPSPAKDGSGMLLVIKMRGLKEGQTQFSLANVQLASREGTVIQFSTTAGDVTISNTPQSGPTPTPFAIVIPKVTVAVNPTNVAPTSAAPTATGVAQAAGATLPATEGATQQSPAGAPTLAPTYTPTSEPAAKVKASTPTPTATNVPSGGAFDFAGSPLFIISTILELIVVIFLIMLVLRRRKTRKK